MNFKIKYKLDITIADEDRLSPERKKKDNKLLGEICTIQGSKDKIKRELNKLIDELSDKLEKWYYGDQ